MNRVWARVIATAKDYAARRVVLSEPEAREVVLAIAAEEGVGHPGEHMLEYLSWPLVKRTERPM